jgi:hypothetical protein
MSPWLQSTSLFLTLLGLACGFGTHPDAGGRYTPQFPQTPLNNQVCETDLECMVTRRRDGDCCGNACNNSQAYNLSSYEALLAHQNDICPSAEFECPHVKCEARISKTVARCVNQRCVAVEVPLTEAP